MISWNFTPRLPYTEASGDYVPGKALQSVKSLSPDEILTREGCQNTLNQPLDNEEPVRVDISVIELTGRYKQEFLDHLQYEKLEGHLTAIASKKSSFGIQIKNALKQINENSSLILYKIEDFNSNGLTGYEDTIEVEDDTQEESNFFNLCRANFITSQNAKSSRGGSYGVGKSILWKSSLISTVLFSSYIENDANGKLRLFGRSELATHKANKDEYLGAGFFGETKKVEHGSASISSWDNEDLAKKLYLDRDFSRGTGASALVIGYTDSFEEGTPEPLDILQKSRENVAKYFWPCLIDTNKKLEVKFHHIRNGKLRETFDTDLTNWQPFINASNKEGVDIANDVDLVARKNFNITVAEATEDPAAKFNNQAEVSVYRGGEELKNHDNKNTIALIRGFGMVVKYYTPTSTPINDSLPFFAVAKVGEAIDTSKKNEKTENFFKYSEPPLHDSWEKSTESLKQRYKGYTKSIEEFYDSLSKALNELCGKTENKSKNISSILSSMLNFGLKSEKKIQIKPSNIQAKQIDEYIWKVGGTIEINKLQKNNTWKTEFGFTIKEENKLGERLSFQSINFDYDENINLLNTDTLTSSNSAIVQINDVKHFTFEGEINTKDTLDKLNLNQLGNYNPSIISLGFYTKDVAN